MLRQRPETGAVRTYSEEGEFLLGQPLYPHDGFGDILAVEDVKHLDVALKFSKVIILRCPISPGNFAENDDAATSVSYCQHISFVVEFHGGEYVILVYLVRVGFSETHHVDEFWLCVVMSLHHIFLVILLLLLLRFVY